MRLIKSIEEVAEVNEHDGGAEDNNEMSEGTEEVEHKEADVLKTAVEHISENNNDVSRIFAAVVEATSAPSNHRHRQSHHNSAMIHPLQTSTSSKTSLLIIQPDTSTLMQNFDDNEKEKFDKAFHELLEHVLHDLMNDKKRFEVLGYLYRHLKGECYYFTFFCMELSFGFAAVSVLPADSILSLFLTAAISTVEVCLLVCTLPFHDTSNNVTHTVASLVEILQALLFFL